MADAQKEAGVVGGSISGLMNAIMLRQEGYKAHVLERSHPSALHSEAAGLSVGMNVHSFLHKYVKNYKNYGIKITQMKVWNEKTELQAGAPTPYVMHMTNWKTMYDLLKDALLDDEPNFPVAVYKTRSEVIDVREENARVSVRFRDGEVGQEDMLQADLVIAAEGANSSVRRRFGEDALPAYAGYVLWRGRVFDELVSERTKEALQDKIVFQRLVNGHMMSYFVPAELTAEGKRDPTHKHDLFGLSTTLFWKTHLNLNRY